MARRSTAVYPAASSENTTSGSVRSAFEISPASGLGARGQGSFFEPDVIDPDVGAGVDQRASQPWGGPQRTLSSSVGHPFEVDPHPVATVGHLDAGDTSGPLLSRSRPLLGELDLQRAGAVGEGAAHHDIERALRVVALHMALVGKATVDLLAGDPGAELVEHGLAQVLSVVLPHPAVRAGSCWVPSPSPHVRPLDRHGRGGPAGLAGRAGEVVTRDVPQVLSAIGLHLDECQHVVVW